MNNITGVELATMGNNMLELHDKLNETIADATKADKDLMLKFTRILLAITEVESTITRVRQRMNEENQKQFFENFKGDK